MTKADQRTMAERFLNEQFAIMKKYGGEPRVDHDRYERAVSETQRTFRSLSPQGAKYASKSA
jgi:hypothetical protein